MHLQILTTHPPAAPGNSKRSALTWPSASPGRGAPHPATTQPLSFGPSATPRPPADQGISQGCTGHRQWEGSGAAGPFRLRSLRVPLGGGIGLGGPCTPRRRGVGEREGVRVPGRRFQESPASLPERPGREGTQRAYEPGGREAGGRGGGRTRGPLPAPPPPRSLLEVLTMVTPLSLHFPLCKRGRISPPRGG